MNCVSYHYISLISRLLLPAIDLGEASWKRRYQGNPSHLFIKYSKQQYVYSLDAFSPLISSPAHKIR